MSLVMSLVRIIYSSSAGLTQALSHAGILPDALRSPSSHRHTDSSFFDTQRSHSLCKIFENGHFGHLFHGIAN